MKKLIMALMLCLVSTVMFTSCDDYEEPIYTYEVSGTGGPFFVTFENSSNNTQQEVVNNGWTYTIPHYMNWLYVSAQNQASYGDVTVKIKENGKILEQTTSHGGYTIATASHSWY